jgi:hypothetical protein
MYIQAKDSSTGNLDIILENQHGLHGRLYSKRREQLYGQRNLVQRYINGRLDVLTIPESSSRPPMWILGFTGYPKELDEALGMLELFFSPRIMVQLPFRPGTP